MQLRKAGPLPPYQLGGICIVGVTFQPDWSLKGAGRVVRCGELFPECAGWGRTWNIFISGCDYVLPPFPPPPETLAPQCPISGMRALDTDVKAVPRVQESHTCFTYYISFDFLYL